MPASSAGDLFDLTGRVAVVTGGNQGIGFAMADALACAGADLALWSRRPETNAAAAQELRRHGREVLAVSCDITNDEQVAESNEVTLAHFGRLDGCFANAGWVPPVGTTLEQNGDWDRTFDVNMAGTANVLRLAAAGLVEQGKGGSLVATTSIAARYGNPGRAAYSMAKAAVGSLIRTLAVEFGPQGIRANAIVPGFTRTPMLADLLGEDGKADRREASIVRRVPLGRFAEAREFGGIAVYLLSDASTYHTADEFVIDGGYSAF